MGSDVIVLPYPSTTVPPRSSRMDIGVGHLSFETRYIENPSMTEGLGRSQLVGVASSTDQLTSNYVD